MQLANKIICLTPLLIGFGYETMMISLAHLRC